MAGFAERMRQARVDKQGRRNRGASCGSYRGTVRVRTPADVYRGLDEMELDLAALVHATFVDPMHGFREDLAAVVAELNDATLCDEIPF